MLTSERLREILEYSPTTGEFTWKVDKRGHIRRGMLAGSIDPRGYRRIAIEQKFYYAHRLAWLWVHGETPEMIDHANLDKSDNRISNLRLADKSLNAANSVGIRDVCKGVYRRGDKWIVRAGKRHVGTYSSYGEAEVAYRAQAKILYGEFARA